MTQLQSRIKVAVFGSGSGTVLEAILHGQSRYKVQVALADRQCRFLQIADSHQVPTIYHSYKRHAGPKDAFDELMLDLLEPYDPDIIFLAGYMRLIRQPLLKAYPNRILNVHPADLTLTDDQGNRKYVGMDAIADALKQGETSTRSTVIIVDEGIDTGKIVALGPSVPYTGGWPVTEEALSEHRDKHKRLSDWVVSVEALNLIAEGNCREISLCAASLP